MPEQTVDNPDSIVLEEEIDPNYIPSESEVVEYAKWLGMDLDKDTDLFWVAREGLMAPLPKNWKPCKTKDTEDIYYFNFQTGESTWDHPCDGYYKRLYEVEKKKKEVSMKEKADDVRTEAKKTAEQLTGKEARKKKKKKVTTELADLTAPGKKAPPGGVLTMKALPGIAPKLSSMEPVVLGRKPTQGAAPLSVSTASSVDSDADMPRSSATSNMGNANASTLHSSKGSRLRSSLQSAMSDSTDNDASFERRTEEAKSVLTGRESRDDMVRATVHTDEAKADVPALMASPSSRRMGAITPSDMGESKESKESDDANNNINSNKTAASSSRYNDNNNNNNNSSGVSDADVARLRKDLREAEEEAADLRHKMNREKDMHTDESVAARRTQARSDEHKDELQSKVTKLENDMRSTKEATRDLETEKLVLEAKLRQKESGADALAGASSDTQYIEEMESRLKEKAERLRAAEDEVYELKKKLSSSDLAQEQGRRALEQNLQDTLDKLKRKNFMLEDVRKERDDLRKDAMGAAAAKKDADEAQSSAASLRADLDKTRQDLSSTRTEMDSLREERSRLLSAANSPKAGAGGVGSPTPSLESLASGASATMAMEGLQKKVLELQAQFTEVSSQKMEHEGKAKLLEQKQTFLNDEKDEYEKRFHTERTARMALQADLDKQEMAHSSQSTSLRVQTELAQQGERDVDRLKKRLATLETVREEMSTAEFARDAALAKAKEAEAGATRTGDELARAKAELGAANASAREFREKLLDPMYDPEDAPLAEQHRAEREDQLRQLTAAQADAAKVTGLEEAVRGAKGKEENAMRQLSAAETRVRSLEGEVAAARAESASARDTSVDQGTTNTTVQRQLNEAGARIKTLSIELASEKETSQVLAERAKGRSREVDELRATLQRMESDAGRRAVADSPTKGAKDATRALSRRVEELEQQRAEQHRRIESLQETNGALQSELESYRAAAEDHRKSAAAARNAEMALRVERDTLERGLEEARGRATRLSDDLESTRAGLGLMPAEAQSSDDSLQAYKSKVDMLLEQQQHMQRKISSLSGRGGGGGGGGGGKTGASPASSGSEGDVGGLGAGFESQLEGLSFTEADKDASVIRDVIMDYVRRRTQRKSGGSGSGSGSDREKGPSSTEYWKQKVVRERKFLGEAKSALQRDKDIVKYSQADLSRRKEGWRRKKADAKYSGSSGESKTSLKLLGEAINLKTSDLNRMVTDIRWTQSWLQEREAKLANLERLARHNRRGSGSGAYEVLEETPTKLSMLETEMETDLTFFELSASGLSDYSDDDGMGGYGSYGRRGGGGAGGRNPLKQAPLPTFRGAQKQIPRPYQRDAWTMPPPQGAPLHQWSDAHTGHGGHRDKENMPTTRDANTSAEKVPRPMSANANANTASTRSEIQKFAQKCLQHNQAYDEHAAWLSSLRGEIGKSIHKLHDQGIVANAEMRMASRRDAEAGDFRVEDV